MGKVTLAAIVCVLAAASASGPAAAHHSVAMFDGDKTVVLTGVIRDVKLRNPHSWLVIEVPSAGGAPTTWKLEMAGPYALARMGIRQGVIMPGDMATATMNPMRSGVAEGNLRSISVGGKDFRIGGGG